MNFKKTNNQGYQIPPPAITDLVDAPLTPTVSLSPNGDVMILLGRASLPPIEEVAQRELRLAGIRINPKTNGSSRSSHFNTILIKSITDGKEKSVTGLPDSLRMKNVSWSPDGTRIIFTHTLAHGIELWMVDLKKATAKKLTAAHVNAATQGLPYAWFSDGKNILYKKIPADRGDLPPEDEKLNGPTIQFNEGKSAPVRTYQDLLKSAYDESLFEYFTAAQLVKLNLESGEQKALAYEGMIKGLSTSPDGNYVMVQKIQRPFSYIVPYANFAFDVAILDKEGNQVTQLAQIPLSENIPKGFGATRTGPRNFTWRADAPATIYWVEAQDEGDPKKAVAIRDKLFFLEAPFRGKAKAGIDFELRYGGVTWGNGELAIAYQWAWKNRREITCQWQPDNPDVGKTIIFDRSWEDRYHNPGNFRTHSNLYGRSVLLTTGKNKILYLSGPGASPAGNQPFIDRFDLENKTATRLWQSQAPYYEVPVEIVDIKKGTVLIRRESLAIPPNYFLKNLNTDKESQLTFFQNPYQALDGVKKESLRYQRKDGIELSATLYTPAGYDAKKDGPLPTFMWAYPREYKSADAASQVKDSPYEFTRLFWGSPIYLVTQGYAVLDDFGMPIVGEGDDEPNETFREQLVMDATAAIDKIVAMGVADRNRIAVGGHSYGAFMTANLLAHSNLFAAGIARSGAYNRTLTPFGFQSEERTFWETPETYIKMSPFVHADKIKSPLLLIHGAADNNSGTYPMQSERMFAALKGHGAVVKLVMLPHESHSYRAKESILHMLWEMTTWLDKYVKYKKGG
ncbi:MAG: prolyl oligopeptidase family serine peptidase [Bacteroidota bacterium]